MPDPPSSDLGSLSARAQEILRRADARLAALRPGAEPAAGPEQPAAPEEPGPVPEEPGAVLEEPGREGPLPDLGQLLDTVAAGVAAARAHLVALSASLERVAEELGVEADRLVPGAGPPADTASEAPELGPAAPAVSAPEAPPAPTDAPVSGAAHDAARLVAIEMAVAGDTREGVGRRLHEEFGIRDPAPILDDAFGPDRGGPGRRAYGA